MVNCINDMVIGYSKIENIICIACGDKIKEHSCKNLGRCLFRIQSTYVYEAKKNEEKKEEEKSE